MVSVVMNEDRASRYVLQEMTLTAMLQLRFARVTLAMRYQENTTDRKLDRVLDIV
jgi:hypothetical protein